MSPETINAIKDALAPIAAKIGQGAIYGWDVVVRQQYITAVEGLGLAVLSLIGLVLVGIVAKKELEQKFRLQR